MAFNIDVMRADDNRLFLGMTFGSGKSEEGEPPARYDFVLTGPLMVMYAYTADEEGNKDKRAGTYTVDMHQVMEGMVEAHKATSDG